MAVDATALWYRTWDKRQGRQTQNLPLSVIVGIALRHAQNHPGAGEQVVVQGKSTDLTFGKELTKVARQRLRDLLLFLVASA